MCHIYANNLLIRCNTNSIVILDLRIKANRSQQVISVYTALWKNILFLAMTGLELMSELILMTHSPAQTGRTGRRPKAHNQWPMT